MRHCLAMVIRAREPRLERFTDGAARYFSIRETGRGEHVATLEIKRCGDGETWVVAQCPGLSNRPVSEQTLDFARRLARAYTAAYDAVGCTDARSRAA
jgi:hypothetical protein